MRGVIVSDEAPAAPKSLEDVVVITGYSGAGKSTAMNVFEDDGYFCVDNLPPEMIRGLVDLFVHEGAKVRRAAVVSDVRARDLFETLGTVLDDLAHRGIAHRVLFLDADEQTLLGRYKETRRRHPLSPTGSVAQGIAAERAALEDIKARADFVLDTSGISAATLRRRIADEFLPRHVHCQARRHADLVRPQARAAPRRRHRARHALPAQPALGGGPAPADRLRPARRRVHVARRQARRVLRASRAAAGFPRPGVHRRGQGAPGDCDRLHGRAPSLGGDRRGDRRAAARARRRRGGRRAPRRGTFGAMTASA